MFGQGDMRKLRESLETYNMALSLGMSAFSSYAHPFPDYKNASLTMGRTVNQAVKQDTSAIHEYAVAIKMNTEDILARVNSIRRDGHANRHKGVEDWIEDMAVLSSYAETTYQGTIIDPADMADMAPISESLLRLSEDSALSPSPRGPSPDHSRHTVAGRPREPDPTGSLTQHAARLMLDEISAPSTPSGPTAALSGISADNLDSSALTSALTWDSEYIDGTGNDTSHQLSLFGWKNRLHRRNRHRALANLFFSGQPSSVSNIRARPRCPEVSLRSRTATARFPCMSGFPRWKARRWKMFRALFSSL